MPTITGTLRFHLFLTRTFLENRPGETQVYVLFLCCKTLHILGTQLLKYGRIPCFALATVFRLNFQLDKEQRVSAFQSNPQLFQVSKTLERSKTYTLYQKESKQGKENEISHFLLFMIA